LQHVCAPEKLCLLPHVVLLEVVDDGNVIDILMFPRITLELMSCPLERCEFTVWLYFSVSSSVIYYCRTIERVSRLIELNYIKD
jgi:hypothetical protein